MKLKKVAIFFFLGLILFSSSTSSILSEEYQKGIPTEKRFVIAFDIYHNPILDYRNFTSILEVMNSTLPIDIGVINSTIDERVLSGVDLLVILPKGPERNYKDKEARAISRFLEMGGSLLVMGTFSKKFDEKDINSLLSSINLEGKALSEYFKIGTYEIEGVEDCIYLYDDFSPFENKSILDLNVDNVDFLENSTRLVVQSIAIEVNSKEVEKIYATPTTYGRDSEGNPCCYLNSTPVIAAFLEKNKTRVSLIGFAESLSNSTSPLGDPWIELGENRDFFISMLLWLIKPEMFQLKQLVRPSYVYYSTALSAFIALPLFLLIRKIEEAKRVEKEKPKKLSELLKKVREE